MYIIHHVGLSQEILGIDGAAFSAELRFTLLRFRLLDEGKTKSVRTSNVQSAAIQPNGYTKIVVRYGKDLTIPTSSSEAVQLVKAFNELISEIKSVELRKRELRWRSPITTSDLSGRGRVSNHADIEILAAAILPL